ncbi:MAG: hypothetical protein KY459_12630 [Acidobacteria bacterium]|nr:hypothetical protein [Acidobacteriota bacterium]
MIENRDITEPPHQEPAKRGLAWLWAAIVVILLILLFVWLWPTGEEVIEPIDTEVAEEIVPLDPPPASEVDTAVVDFRLADIRVSPVSWSGRQVSGEATVAEVPTDRGFWIEEDGQRLFVVLIDEPAEVPKDINANQRIRFRDATVHTDASDLDAIPGEPLSASTRQIIAGEPAFLVVDERNVEIL